MMTEESATQGTSGHVEGPAQFGDKRLHTYTRHWAGPEILWVAVGGG